MLVPRAFTWGKVLAVINCIAAVHILVSLYTAEVTQIVTKLHTYATNHLKAATELWEVKQVGSLYHEWTMGRLIFMRVNLHQPSHWIAD